MASGDSKPFKVNGSNPLYAVGVLEAEGLGEGSFYGRESLYEANWSNLVGDDLTAGGWSEEKELKLVGVVLWAV